MEGFGTVKPWDYEDPNKLVTEDPGQDQEGNKDQDGTQG